MTRNSNMTKNLLRALLLALAMVMLYVSPAFAADASTWQEVRDLVNSGNNVTITLTDDVTATSTLPGGKNVTIDLNGHTITVASDVGSLFETWQGSVNVTIKDSAQTSVNRSTVSMPDRSNQSATSVPNGTGIGRAATYKNGVLTYYETTSAVRDTIYTTETHKKVDVTVKGGIVREGNSNAALFAVNGGNSSVTIEGGFFHNPNGRVIDATAGADVTISGGIFYGSSISGEGGAVSVVNWEGNQRSAVSISNAIFAGNTATSGGAVAVTGHADLTIGNGAVFSGNRATGSGHDGGGAILIGWNTNATMSGGLVTHNWCTDNVIGASGYNSSYDVCGGGIMVRGTLKMTGGQVTSNEAPGGGGISTSFWDGGVFLMTDGIVAGNVARLNEGGGITINMNGRGSIIGGHITNNRAEGKEHWGGGGIFSSNDSVLTMINTLIAYNEAGGFGGGLAGCSTARVDTHSVEIQNHSVAIYNNEAAGENTSGNNSTKNEDHLYAKNDPFFMREGDYYQDYFSALNTTVCGGFLGEGNALWEGTIDSTEIKQGDIKPGEKVTSQSIAGLTSNPSSGDISKAIQAADVFVTGNYAYTHGGGILSNGYMIIGSHRFMEIGDRMTLKGDKTLSGGQLRDGQFTFVVTDEDDNELFTGTNNASSEIIFNGRLTFDKAGTYTFKVYEQEHNIEGVTKDPTVYTIVVTVRATETTVYAVDDDDITKTEAIKVTFNKISAVKVYKSGVDDPVLDLSNIEKDDRSAYELPGDVLEFVNRISQDTGIVVSKTVVDASNSSANAEFDFTVELSDKTINGVKGDMTFTDGVAHFTLKAGQSKRAIKLPVGITYTVTETAKDGYYTPNPSKIGTVVADTVNSVVFVNYAVGELTVTKTVDSLVAADMNRDFTFRITLADGGSGVYSGVSFTNGVANVALKHNESITISDLPAGMDYTVEELTADGFNVVATGTTGEIATNQTKTAAFTNTRKTGELHLRKYVVGTPSDLTDPEFTFTVKLVDALYLNGTFGDMTFKDGIATVSLGHGDVVKATGLPLGVHYQITEAQSDDYAVGIVGNSSGAIVAQPTVVQYTNTYFAGLEISKTTTGSALDRDMAFEFEITLTDSNGQPISGTYSGVTFVDGKASVFLKNGQSKVIDGLEIGTTATVMEKRGEHSDHFIIQVNGQTVDLDSTTPHFEHTFDDGDHAHARFSNLHRVGELEITKTTNSPIAEDLNRQFGFDVELSAPINGTFGNMVFTDGKATVYLANGQSAKAVNIPIGVTYTVTERAVTGFDSDPAGPQTGTMTEAGVKLAYTNTRRLGGFKLTKIVLAGEETEAKFGFKVILSSPYTGTFGDMTFVNGVAEFELVDEQSIEAQDLPEGTVYQIVETTYDAAHFEPVVGTVVGNISANVTKTVNFTNRALDSLSVSKRVDGVVFEPDKEFTFTVELSDKTINGVKGDMEFVNGVATFTLKHGESATANGLPEGTTYTVTEENYDDYTTTSNGATGTISNNGASAASFVNTRKVGDLAVSKTLVSKRTADVNQEFTFTVTLSDTNINGAFGDMTFVDGVATVALRGGQTKTAKGLPTGITYTVTEATADGFVLTSKTGDTGTITQTASTAAFTNTREVGDLTISKTVISDKAADADQEFTFTVTLDDRNISGTYDDMAFNKGIATVNLKGGASATATGLPTGIGYTVTEATAEGFALTSKTGDTGVISTTEAVAAFTNTRDTGDLEVSKVVVSVSDYDKTKHFNFTVTLSDKSITGKFGDMIFTEGVATFTLTDGLKKTATGLPTGITYKVDETVADAYTTTYTGETGTISTTKSEAIVTNTRQTGGLKVSKTVVGAPDANKNDTYEFTVTLTDASFIDGKFGEMEFVNGVATFELADGQTKTAIGLPIGIHYTVTENETSDEYAVSIDGIESGPIAAGTSEVKFTNTYFSGLVISKQVIGASQDHNTEFKFLITLKDADSKPVTGEINGVTFDANGQATITLKDGQNLILDGLEIGTTATVTETDVDKTHFKVQINSVDKTEAPTFEHKMENGDHVHVHFTNVHREGSLEISKKTISPAESDLAREFVFTVTLKASATASEPLPISGKFGDMFFTNGVATVQIKNDQTVTATKLPAGVYYSVEEAKVAGFGSGATNRTGTIVELTDKTGPNKVEFTNTREVGDLEVTKTVASAAAADKDQAFNFTVELSNKTINGTFAPKDPTTGEIVGDGMTFVDGVATFTLKHGETKTAAGLPTNITYTVTEESVNGFATTSTGATGTISTAKTTAAFTNTRATSGLAVTKTVVSKLAADKEVSFNFTVTLSDKTISGTYGDMTFTAGEATFTLKDGESVIADGLPTGVDYKVEEETADGFVTTYTGATGTITDRVATVAVTNTRATSGLTVTKTVKGDVLDTQKKFTFTVTLSDATITGVYGDMSFANGVAKFELAHSESKTAENLPIGVEYTVTEQADANYTTTYNGVTDATEATGTISDAAAVVEVTNTIKTGDLKVTKTVAGNAAEAGQKFSFKVVLSDALNGPYGDMTFENGEATFELANGENKTAVGLPVGVTYTITEAHSGYVATVNGVTTDTATGTINIGEILVAYTNTKTQEVGGLKVEKTVIGLDADAQKAFTFTVTLDDATITGTYAVKDPATGVLATNGMDFLNGVATFTLKHGESKVADGLPVGTGYTVAETEDGSFTAAYTNEIGTIVKDTILEAKITNTRKTSGLKVEKTVVSANAADLTKEFTFTVILSDNTITDTYADMTFTAGEATFTLKDGESKTATGLPTGITYTVKEEAAEGFSTTSVGAQGMISEQLAEAKFTNTADGDLIVRKTVTGTAGDKSLPFNFTVTLSDANINGTYGEMTFVAGVATFTLKDGENKTAVGLPANIGYTVTEENGEYTVTKTGDVGTIPAGALAEAKFTNTLDTQSGGLKVTKTISGNAANMADRFNFTVTLSDLTLTGTYGEMVFTNGVATFELGHNESKSASGLPAGIGYTVKEQPSTYAVYATGDTGIINADTVSVAPFINTRNISLGGLTVTKTVTGEDGSKMQSFRFTVELLNANISGTYGEMLFVNGVANFTLTDGQTKTAMNLPAGTQYRVTEENSGYVVTKTGDVGYIPADGMATAAFINHLSIARGDLRVSKFVTGDKADVTRKFNFRVTLTSPLTGTYGNMTFENGVATFALAHGESAFATRLPAGVQYVVEELDYEDYIVTATDDVGTIEADTTAQVTFINGRMPDTGDHSMISVYSTLMLLSAALLCIRGFKAKKA